MYSICTRTQPGRSAAGCVMLIWKLSVQDIRQVETLSRTQPAEHGWEDASVGILDARISQEHKMQATCIYIHIVRQSQMHANYMQVVPTDAVCYYERMAVMLTATNCLV